MITIGKYLANDDNFTLKGQKVRMELKQETATQTAGKEGIKVS